MFYERERGGGGGCYIYLIEFHDRDAHLSYAGHSVINGVIANGVI